MHVITRLTIVAFMILIAACSSNSGTQVGGGGSLSPFAMQSGGRDVLVVMAPPDTTFTSTNGFIHLKSREGEVEFWRVRGATSIEEGVKRIDKEITSEFKGFNPTKSTDLTVAGSPAKQVQGSGTEADDGDPGDADVIVFQVEGHIFIACTHGEGLSSAARKWMAALVQTARKP